MKVFPAAETDRIHAKPRNSHGFSLEAEALPLRLDWLAGAGSLISHRKHDAATAGYGDVDKVHAVKDTVVFSDFARARACNRERQRKVGGAAEK